MPSQPSMPTFPSMLMQPSMPAQPSVPTPLGMLNTSSTPDAPQPPVIVSSTNAAAAQSPESNGSQEPIGTKGDDVKPAQPRVMFTTDFGSDIPFQGGHYLKISGIDANDAKAFEVFKKNVSRTLLTVHDPSATLLTYLSDPVQDPWRQAFHDWHHEDSPHCLRRHARRREGKDPYRVWPKRLDR